MWQRKVMFVLLLSVRQVLLWLVIIVMLLVGKVFDLSDLTLTGVQEDLVEAIHATGKPVIVVLLSGKPFAMSWIKENIPGIVVQWYPGEQGGLALADMLLGKVNPSGKN